MKEKALLILAGGLGSRFGGLKQVEPVDEQNNFIIDYSIFDAIRTGFNKVIFVIKEENYKIFKETIGKRIEKHIKVEYVFQGLNDYVPQGIDFSKRQKPWGTGHAVLVARDKIQGDFTVINADDFYGLDGFRVASNFFDENKDEKVYGLVGYMVGNTLTENGAVKRGVCEVKDDYFITVNESSIERKNGVIYANKLGTDEIRVLPENYPVNMNLICFRKNYIDILEKRFKDFVLDKNTNLEKDEFLLLNEVSYAIKNYGYKMKMLKTSAVWHGFTYKEDKEKVVNAIKKLKEENQYPNNLWSSDD